MKRLATTLLMLVLAIGLFADQLMITSPDRTMTLYGDYEDEDYVLSCGDEEWSLVATQSNVDGVRLRGANRVRSQSLFSLTVVEPDTGRLLTLNSNVADEISYEVDESSIRLEYSFEEGISMPLELRLEDDGLHVSIDTSKIGESEDLFITDLQLLPFFSDSSSLSEGYFLIPDGEGALLNFNNGKAGTYRQAVYSRDMVDSSLVRTTSQEVVRLPLFGVEKDGGTLLVIATSGAGIATLNAQSSSSSNPYNQCWFSYKLRRSEDQGIAEDAFQTIYESPRAFNSTIELVITPCDGDGYMGMAECFREQYVQENSLAIKAVLDVDMLDLEALDIFGIPTPFDVVNEDASWDDVQSSVSVLRSYVDGSLLINFNSWNKDQLAGKAESDLKWDDFPLSTKEREALSASLNAEGVVVSASYDPVSTRSRSSDAIRNLSDERVAQYAYKVNSSYRNEESRHYLRNVSGTAFDVFQGETYLPAFETIGELSYSDYNHRGPMDKDAYAKAVASKLNGLGSPYAVVGGNAYTLGGCFHVLEAPMQSSGFDVLDEAVPFYEIVLSGRISYSFAPINNCADSRLMLLRILETGALPAFSVDKHVDLDFIQDFCSQYMDDILLCAGQEVVYHELLSPSARRTTFANGTVVCVDYSTRIYEIVEEGR